MASRLKNKYEENIMYKEIISFCKQIQFAEGRNGTALVIPRKVIFLSSVKW